MNWYVGQEIVAIRDHSQGLFKKGDEFTIKGIRDPYCPCKGLLIDVGLIRNGVTVCGRCKIVDTIGGNWFRETNFVPKEPEMSELTVEALLEELELEMA
jgi:hypothetical protein